MTTFSLDRIEEGIAVCESEDGEVLHVRAQSLPTGVREGSLLSFSDGQWTLLEAQTDRVRQKLFQLQESLFDA